MTPNTSLRALENYVVVLVNEEEHQRVMWWYDRSIRLDSDPDVFFLNKGLDRETLGEAPILRVDRNNICFERQDNGEWVERGVLIPIMQAQVMAGV